MKTLKQNQPKILAAAVLIGLFGLSGNGFAAPGGQPGPNPTPGGGSGGNPPPEETAGNNLSMPTKFVPGGTTDQPSVRVLCDGELHEPTPPFTELDPPLMTDKDGNTTDLPLANYYLQKTDSLWSGECVNAGEVTDVTVTTKWGDNLVGDGQLKARKPIRVEMSLTENNGIADYQGYKVWKLTDEEDRFATYGTRGAPEDLLNALPYMVFDSGAELSIDKCTTMSAAGCTAWSPLIVKGPMSAEINSTGKVVYGYNWGVSTKGVKETPDAGTYRLRFYANNTTITENTDAKATLCDPNCSEVIVTLTAGGGSGKPASARK